MAAASASLALAACGGGGDSTVAIPEPVVKAPPTRDCTATPKPPGCPPDKPEVPPVPFASLGTTEKNYAVAALKNTWFGINHGPITLLAGKRDASNTRHGHVFTESAALQMTAWKDRILVAEDDKYKDEEYRSRDEATRVVKVTPMGSSDIKYQFSVETIRPVYGTSAYPSSDKNTNQLFAGSLESVDDKPDLHTIFTIKENDWKLNKKVNLDLDESYSKYNNIKDYRTLTAEVDTDNDKQNDATLHTEIWTDLPSSGNADYLVGGVWLLIPNNIADAKSYEFGGFVRGQNPVGYSGTEKYRNRLTKIVGSATYKGMAAGLHTSLDSNNTVKISRLLGKVNMNVNFDTNAIRGTVNGRIDDLKLDGKNVGGALILEVNMEDNLSIASFNKDINVGNIEGINYKGSWAAVFQMDGATDADLPGGVVGTIGGSGGDNSFVATFGGYKVTPEE